MVGAIDDARFWTWEWRPSSHRAVFGRVENPFVPDEPANPSPPLVQTMPSLCLNISFSVSLPAILACLLFCAFGRWVVASVVVILPDSIPGQPHREATTWRSNLVYLARPLSFPLQQPSLSLGLVYCIVIIFEVHIRSIFQPAPDARFCLSSGLLGALNFFFYRKSPFTLFCEFRFDGCVCVRIYASIS